MDADDVMIYSLLIYFSLFVFLQLNLKMLI